MNEIDIEKRPLPCLVSFTVHEPGGWTDGKAILVGAFSLEADAKAYAQWAARTPGSCEPTNHRVFHVTRGRRKYLYRAG